MAALAFWVLLLLSLGAIAFEVLLIATAAQASLQQPGELLYGLWWLVVLACSSVLVARSLREKRAGRTGAAAGTLAILVLPALVGIGFYLYVAWMIWAGIA